MGYRYQLMSCPMTPYYGELPEWFVEKWEDRMDFDDKFWTSKGEFKYWGDFLEDTATVYKEMPSAHTLPWQFVQFADEGHLSSNYHIDIQHHWIDEEGVKTSRGDFNATCSCDGWGCTKCCSSEAEIRARQGTFS